VGPLVRTNAAAIAAGGYEIKNNEFIEDVEEETHLLISVVNIEFSLDLR